jgi:hypothetical protein
MAVEQNSAQTLDVISFRIVTETSKITRENPRITGKKALLKNGTATDALESGLRRAVPVYVTECFRFWK